MSKAANRFSAISIAFLFTFTTACSSIGATQNQYSAIKATAGLDSLELNELGGSSGDPSPGIKGVYELFVTGIVLAGLWAIPIYLVHKATD